MTSRPLLGINFSHQHAAWLGLDPSLTLRRLLGEAGARYLRLSVRWEEISPEPSRLDFTPLRPWLEIAGEYEARVLISVGLKAQRHPEFYPPAWLTEAQPLPHGARIVEQERVVALLLLMLERVTAYLADFDVIDAWQVENEPFLPAASRTVGWRISPGLLEREIGVVREADPRSRPVVVNHSSFSAFDRWWLQALRPADVLAQNLYPRVPAPKLWPGRYFNRYHMGPLAPALRRQAALARRLGKDFWITELQGEPWEPAGMAAVADGSYGSISPERLRANLRLAERTTASRIYFWGAEWWMYMAERRGDDRYWNVARELFGAGS